MRRPLTAPVLGLATVLLLTGCGPESELDLDLRSVAVTVPRLVTPAVELVPAAPAPPPVALPPVQLPPLPVFSLPPVVPPSLTPTPSSPACPKASQFAVPDQPETIIVTAPPVAGTTTHTATGSHSSTTGQGPLAEQVRTTTTALPSATTSAGQRVDAWQVERTGSAGGSSVELYQLVHPSTDPLATAAGVYLVGMAWKDPVRGDLSFQPEGGGLQVLPVPVQLGAEGGAQYAGSATDPSTLTTLSLTRNVTGRKRVDICGEPVDTFTVQMSGVLTTRDTQRQVAWTQQLATAYGAANVEETLTLTSPVEGFTWTRSLLATEVPDVPKAAS